MSKTSLEVRIPPIDKVAAMARAKAQGVTLSEGVRRLLGLWVEERIDFADLDALALAPRADELQALSGKLADLQEAAAEVCDELGALLDRYGDDLQRPPVTWYDLREMAALMRDARGS